jgi:hypothetical protein
MEVNGIAVMRRRHDSWLNATQILKVAGIEKGMRTEILEKEILTGELERVQGGHGKYRGTWIKFEKGLELCRSWGVEKLLRPLLTYDMSHDGREDELARLSLQDRQHPVYAGRMAEAATAAEAEAEAKEEEGAAAKAKEEEEPAKAKWEAAKPHITALGNQSADETTHTLKIEPKYHRELIGAQGSQINKFQTRYKVQIHFPRSARSIKDGQSFADSSSEAGQKGPRRMQAEDEVVIRGPSKGADEARDEILSLLQYLKDNSYSATVSVQQNQIPSLIGQGGKGMDELRQLTGAKIDVPGSRDAKDPSELVEIQIKGTKAQVAQAKKLFEENKQAFETVSRTLEVDKKHHRALIGAGGESSLVCSICHHSNK